MLNGLFRFASRSHGSRMQKVVFSPDGSRLRYSSKRRVASLDLRAFDQHIHNNLVYQLTRLSPEVVEQEGRDEALRMVERLRDIHPQAFQRGMAELAAVEEEE